MAWWMRSSPRGAKEDKGLSKIEDVNKIKCSFCGKSSNEVEKMIVASDDVCICNECVGLCSEVLQEEIDKK